MEKLPYVWGCQECDMEFDAKQDAIAHLQTAHGEGVAIEMRPRYATLFDLWIAAVSIAPTPIDEVVKILQQPIEAPRANANSQESDKQPLQPRGASSRAKTRKEETRRQKNRACQKENG